MESRSFNSHFAVIKAPGMDVLKVPLCEPQQNADGVSCWEWSGSAMDEGDGPSKWFSDYLGKPSRLVRFNAGQKIQCSKSCWMLGMLFNFLVAVKQKERFSILKQFDLVLVLVQSSCIVSHKLITIQFSDQISLSLCLLQLHKQGKQIPHMVLDIKSCFLMSSPTR